MTGPPQMLDRRIALGHFCSLTVTGKPASPVVGLHGEIDVSSAASLRAALYDVVDDQPPAVVLDAGNLSFLDVSGLGVLLEIDEWLRRGGSSGIAVRKPSRVVRRLLQLSGHLAMVEPEGAGAGRR